MSKVLDFIEIVYVLIRHSEQQVTVVNIANGESGMTRKTPSKFTGLYSKGLKIFKIA